MEEAPSAGPSKPCVDCAFAKPAEMSEERRMAGAILRSHLSEDQRALIGICLAGAVMATDSIVADYYTTK
jgi:hypothetical protein